MNIYYLAPHDIILPAVKKRLSRLGTFTWVPMKNVSEKEIPRVIKNADILLISPGAVQKIGKKFFDAIPDCVYLVLLSSGYDQVDIHQAALHKVRISCCEGVNAQSVAEHTWGLILTLARHIAVSDRDIRSRSVKEKKQYEGIELAGKTLGILGTGHVGSLVARIGKSFDMRVLGCNAHGKMCAYVDRITDPATVLSQADIISVHLPLSDGTKHFLDAKKLARLKPGVILVNTAQEQIVDTKVVVRKLQDGSLYGYGVDADECDLDDPLLRFPNVIITNHTAYNTRDAKIRMQEYAVLSIEAYVKRKQV